LDREEARPRGQKGPVGNLDRGEARLGADGAKGQPQTEEKPGQGATSDIKKARPGVRRGQLAIWNRREARSGGGRGSGRPRKVEKRGQKVGEAMQVAVKARGNLARREAMSGGKRGQGSTLDRGDAYPRGRRG